MAFVCAVGESVGKLGIFLPMLNWVEFCDGMEELRIEEKSVKLDWIVLFSALMAVVTECIS